MRKMACSLLGLLMLLSSAQAGESFEGTVVAGETLTVTAPYGAAVESLLVRQGESIHAGQEILLLDPAHVVATEDGAIRGLFAQEGDSAEDTVMYLAPVSRYTVSANIRKAAETAENRYVFPGEKVYLQCSKDGTHRGWGVITGIDGSSYTVQTTAGEFYMEETVYVYRGAEDDDESCIGSGTVSRTEALAISGSGSILRLHVADGETVERGQLLMETVEGHISEDVLADAAVRTPFSGIVTEIHTAAGQTVSQGDILLTLAQPESFLIRFPVAEDRLSQVHAGMEASIYFSWKEDKSSPCRGTVTEVSYVADSGAEDEDVSYYGYIAFTADDTVRQGMTAAIVLD